MTRSRWIFLLASFLALVAIGVLYFYTTNPSSATTTRFVDPGKFTSPAIAQVAEVKNLGPYGVPRGESEPQVAESSPVKKFETPLSEEPSQPGDYAAALADPDLTDDVVRARLKAAALDVDRSAEDRADALAHLQNLALGREMEELLPVARDPAATTEQLAELLDESLNRPLPYQAELALSMLELARDPVLQEAARRHLIFLVGTDYGADFPAWRAALTRAAEKWPRLVEPGS